VLLAAMPAGATTSILASKYDQDPKFATELVVSSTLLSLPSVALWSFLVL
jgi:predicted permease